MIVDTEYGHFTLQVTHAKSALLGASITRPEQKHVIVVLMAIVVQS